MSDQNIYQRINAVRKKVEYIRKDATVQGYRAVTHDQVTAHVRDHLIAQGIVIVPDQRMAEIQEVGKTSKGTTIIRYDAWYEISFVNCDDPSDAVRLRVNSHANDQGDKAPGKALSMAVKYAILKLFSLETGENEESRVGEERKGKLVIDHLKDELNEYLECNDSLAVMLMAKHVGHDMWTELYNSAPDGKKVAWKKQLTDQEKTGHEVLKAINQAILTDDSLMAKENIADITDGGKRLLAQHIGHEKAAVLGKLVSS